MALQLSAQQKPMQHEPGPAGQVNVFLGASGDHGQMSPAASYPFSMLSIGPQTYPTTHMGYEYLAKKFLGFTHNRFEGVGCQGSGGNILIRPFLGTEPSKSVLMKTADRGEPGYYEVAFENGIKAQVSVLGNSGKHLYEFPKGEKGIYIDLSHCFVNRFVAEAHQIEGNSVSGWIEAKTTCSAGKYKLYYYLELEGGGTWKNTSAHELQQQLESGKTAAVIHIALSAVSTQAAKASLDKRSFEEMKKQSFADWNKELGKIAVEGESQSSSLFYSLLYRTMQSPYVISEKDGQYRDTKGAVQKDKMIRYNGWAIWDNYRTQLPLLSIVAPERYTGMVKSIEDLYRSGKKNYATQTEPSNTVRTEHAGVVLLDAYRKGYPVDFKSIADSLEKDAERLDYKSPDKALESSYDQWALSGIFEIIGDKEKSSFYKTKTLQYKTYWSKDFKDMKRKDVDQMQARGLYQGTIWQYRWFVPYDVKGLMELDGGEEAYLAKLDEFFDNDYYNHANEPDLQVPLMYNPTAQVWKSQDWMHRLAVDTVVQNYFNDNSRGIGSNIGKIYRNQPEAYLRTMDDDAGAMSAWYVFTASGFSPACVGWPVYYFNVPLFKSLSYQLPAGKKFRIEVENFDPSYKYISKVFLNGKEIHRNYLSQQEITSGGLLKIIASPVPVHDPNLEKWISSFQ
jgi:putative alpha-1,2-mannosidase